MEWLRDTFSMAQLRRALISPRDARRRGEIRFYLGARHTRQRKANSSTMFADDSGAAGHSPAVSLV